MEANPNDRLLTELALLESMYPDQTTYNKKARELTFTSSAGTILQLRLPETYLQDSLPEVLSASSRNQDLRNQVKDLIADYSPGEEVLDAIIASFTDLSETTSSSKEQDGVRDEVEATSSSDADAKATIVVWLHHLLNTNKRKQALAPSSTEVSGITKPGYPGVLVYSGSATAVHEHVNELKQQNWQAFQVRLESDELWTFQHGAGVIEVEAMKDVVAEIGEDRKELFMEAMRMK